MERINYNKIELKFKELKYLVSGGGMEKINYNKIEMNFKEMKYLVSECVWKKVPAEIYSGIRGVYYG